MTLAQKLKDPEVQQVMADILAKTQANIEKHYKILYREDMRKILGISKSYFGFLMKMPQAPPVAGGARVCHITQAKFEEWVDEYWGTFTIKKPKRRK